MDYFCNQCLKNVETTFTPKIFNNGSVHLEVRCGLCKTFIKYRAQAPLDPLSFKIPFGKHQGKTLAQIYETDRQYVSWLSKNAFKTKIQLAAKGALEILGK